MIGRFHEVSGLSVGDKVKVIANNSDTKDRGKYIGQVGKIIEIGWERLSSEFVSYEVSFPKYAQFPCTTFWREELERTS